MKRKNNLLEQAERYLALREHSRYELQEKLKQKGHAYTEVQSVLDLLQTQGLQSDSRFCDAYLRMRARKGFGPNYIRQALREKGVVSELIEQSLAEVDVDWAHVICLTWQKKFANPPLDLKDKAKQQRFLSYRGFSAEHIRQFFSSLLAGSTTA